MPNTKLQTKYLGPYTVSRITESHAVIPNPKKGLIKEKKISIDIARPFYERDFQPNRHPVRKRKSEGTIDPPNKKQRMVT